MKNGPSPVPTCHQKPPRYRALNPWVPGNAAVLEVIARGEWAVAGLRNKDLRSALYPRTDDTRERRRQAGRTTRMLALLRAHGVLRKVSGTHRYIITPHGRNIITALLAARKASVPELLKIAA